MSQANLNRNRYQIKEQNSALLIVYWGPQNWSAVLGKIRLEYGETCFKKQKLENFAKKLVLKTQNAVY